MDMRPPATATTTSPEQRVQKQSFSDAKGAEGGGTRLPPRANHPARTEVEISSDVVRGGTDVYPFVQGTLASSSMYSPTENIVVECFLDTGCLFANLVKADIARRLGPHTQSADKRRLVTLADGSLTSSVGYVSCDVTLTHDET